MIFSGIAVASVLGVPAGTLLGSFAGRAWAFTAMAGCALAVAGALAVLLPPLPAERPVRLGTFPGLLRRPPVRRALTTVALLVTGHFAAYTYVRPVLQRTPRHRPGPGQRPAARLRPRGRRRELRGRRARGLRPAPRAAADRRAPRRRRAAADPRRRLGGRLGGAAAGVGVAYGGVSVSAQNLLSAAAPQDPEAASALFAGVFNTAIALGAPDRRPARGRTGG